MSHVLHFPIHSEDRIEEIKKEEIPTKEYFKQMIEIIEEGGGRTTWTELKEKGFTTKELICLKLSGLVNCSGSLFTEWVVINKNYTPEKFTEEVYKEIKECIYQIVNY